MPVGFPQSNLILHPQLIQVETQAKFTKQMLYLIIGIIVVFFGGFMLLINAVSGSSSLGFINAFFTFFIVICIAAVTFGYLMSNQLGKRAQKQVSRGTMRGNINFSAKKTSFTSEPHAKPTVNALLCASCGSQVSSSDKFCLECGSSLN